MVRKILFLFCVPVVLVFPLLLPGSINNNDYNFKNNNETLAFMEYLQQAEHCAKPLANIACKCMQTHSYECSLTLPHEDPNSANPVRIL
jgi:hypothetical protein